MHAIIGTWKMCYVSVKEAFAGLAGGGSSRDAIAAAIMPVEDDPRYVSVGYGGLPARDGRVTLDAAYMDGRTLRYGGVICAEGIRNPIQAAILLSERKRNCLLAGPGAAEFALSAGLAMRDMRTQESLQRWSKAICGLDGRQEAYRGHDTVCVIALDTSGGMSVGTSTSGLFLKEPGRVGDTPVIGSGFYCDARYGAAAATGLGEDIMRGCFSFNAVSLIRRGAAPQEACDETLHDLCRRLRELDDPDGGISLIAMDVQGNFGAATSLNMFPFAAARAGESPRLLTAQYGDPATKIRVIPDDETAALSGD